MPILSLFFCRMGVKAFAKFVGSWESLGSGRRCLRVINVVGITLRGPDMHCLSSLPTRSPVTTTGQTCESEHTLATLSHYHLYLCVDLLGRIHSHTNRREAKERQLSPNPQPQSPNHPHRIQKHLTLTDTEVFVNLLLQARHQPIPTHTNPYQHSNGHNGSPTRGNGIRHHS